MSCLFLECAGSGDSPSKDEVDSAGSQPPEPWLCLHAPGTYSAEASKEGPSITRQMEVMDPSTVHTHHVMEDC